MLGRDQVEQLLCLVSSWDRETVVGQFHAFRSRFPVDFTPEFYAAQSVDRLRHLFVALCLQNGRLPIAAAAATTAIAA